MKISVVMATYNGEKYLIEQMDSIRLQTMQPDEVILCDDCSTDNTVKMARSYIERYQLQERWKVTVNQKNLGYANNFHKAAEMASGELIFFADQDDLWLVEKIEKVKRVMEQHSECQLLCTDYEPFSSETDSYTFPKSVLNKMSDDGSLERISIGKKSVYIGALGCCMCVRKEFYQQVREYWFDGWAQDDRMWRLAQCVDGCYLLHSNLVRHRLHDNNTATYGKYHTIEKRGKLFKNMQYANTQMLRMLTEEKAEKTAINVIRKHIKMMKLRIDLLEKRKVVNSLILIRYVNYYQSIKSMLVEVYIALRSNK